MSSSQPLPQDALPLSGASQRASWAYERLASLARHVLAGRPASAWSLSLMFLLKGSLALLTVAFPLSATQPVSFAAVAGACAIVMGAVIWLSARRLSLLTFELIAVGTALGISLLIARATTEGGMMIGAFSYPWVAIYAAYFFSRRVAVGICAVISAGFAVGLVVNGLPNFWIYWLIVTVTIWSVCLVLSYLSENLRRQADTDPLTGLLNRNGFLAAAIREHAIAERSGEPLTLAVLDLDGFKQVNDIRGHAAGDRLLADLGRSWRERLRTGDILARHGGDEFVLLLPATSAQAAREVLARLDDIGLPMTWSVGLSEWKPGESLSDCLDRADGRLYSVKGALRETDADGAESAFGSTSAPA